MYTQGRLGSGNTGCIFRVGWAQGTQDVYSGWIGFREHKMFTQGRLATGNTRCIPRVGWVYK